MQSVVNKKMSTFRLTPVAREIIENLSEKMGVSQAAVIEMAVRRLAKEEGIQVRDGDKETPIPP